MDDWSSGGTMEKIFYVVLHFYTILNLSFTVSNHMSDDKEYIALVVDCTICVFSDIFVQTNPRGVVPSLVQT